MTLIEYHNLFRTMEGLKPLLENENLNILAQKHAKWMARRNWINSYTISLTNNIAVGNNVDTIIRQWINQPETRAIMFGDYVYIGSGNFQSKTGIIYWCTLYT